MQDKIQEIMGLVDEYKNYGATQDLYAIESKLRELVREPSGYKLVAIEPTREMRRAFDAAVTKYIEEEDDEFDDVYVIKSIIDAAHNITNTSGVE